MKCLLILFLLIIILFLLVARTDKKKETFVNNSILFDSFLKYLLDNGFIADISLARTVAGKSSDLNDLIKNLNEENALNSIIYPEDIVYDDYGLPTVAPSTTTAAATTTSPNNRREEETTTTTTRRPEANDPQNSLVNNNSTFADIRTEYVGSTNPNVIVGRSYSELQSQQFNSTQSSIMASASSTGQVSQSASSGESSTTTSTTSSTTTSTTSSTTSPTTSATTSATTRTSVSINDIEITEHTDSKLRGNVVYNAINVNDNVKIRISLIKEMRFTMGTKEFRTFSLETGFNQTKQGSSGNNNKMSFEFSPKARENYLVIANVLIDNVQTDYFEKKSIIRCSNNHGETNLCCGYGTVDGYETFTCPEDKPYCNGYKKDSHFGRCQKDKHEPNSCMADHGNSPSNIDAKYICNKGLPFCIGYSKSDSGEVYGKCELGGISP